MTSHVPAIARQFPREQCTCSQCTNTRRADDYEPRHEICDDNLTVGCYDDECCLLFLSPRIVRAHSLPVAAGSSFPAAGETATAGTSSRPVVAAELPTVLRSVGTGAASNLGDGLDAALTNEAQR